MKKTIILTTALFFTFSAFAGVSSYQERVDSWLKGTNNSSVNRSIGPGESPEGELSVGSPIGGGLFILSLFAGGYALVNRKRNLEKSHES